MTPETAPYALRGHHVPAFTGDQIAEICSKVCEFVGIGKRTFAPGRAEKLVSRLETYGINVDPIADDEWLDATRATVDPQTLMIYMPERLYLNLCKGKAEAVRIFLHELGHIFLCHKPRFHFSESSSKMEHDSEWQADFFADSIIGLLGLEKVDQQLELKL